MNSLLNRKVIRNFLSNFNESQWELLSIYCLELGIFHLLNRFNVSDLSLNKLSEILEISKENYKKKLARDFSRKKMSDNYSYYSNKYSKNSLSKIPSESYNYSITENIGSYTNLDRNNILNRVDNLITEKMIFPRNKSDLFLKKEVANNLNRENIFSYKENKLKSESDNIKKNSIIHENSDNNQSHISNKDNSNYISNIMDKSKITLENLNMNENFSSYISESNNIAYNQNYDDVYISETNSKNKSNQKSKSLLLPYTNISVLQSNEKESFNKRNSFSNLNLNKSNFSKSHDNNDDNILIVNNDNKGLYNSSSHDKEIQNIEKKDFKNNFIESIENNEDQENNVDNQNIEKNENTIIADVSIKPREYSFEILDKKPLPKTSKEKRNLMMEFEKQRRNTVKVNNNKTSIGYSDVKKRSVVFLEFNTNKSNSNIYKNNMTEISDNKSFSKIMNDTNICEQLITKNSLNNKRNTKCYSKTEASNLNSNIYCANKRLSHIIPNNLNFEKLNKTNSKYTKTLENSNSCHFKTQKDRKSVTNNIINKENKSNINNNLTNLKPNTELITDTKSLKNDIFIDENIDYKQYFNSLINMKNENKQNYSYEQDNISNNNNFNSNNLEKKKILESLLNGFHNNNELIENMESNLEDKINEKIYELTTELNIELNKETVNNNLFYINNKECDFEIRNKNKNLNEKVKGLKTELDQIRNINYGKNNSNSNSNSNSLISNTNGYQIKELSKEIDSDYDYNLSEHPSIFQN